MWRMKLLIGLVAGALVAGAVARAQNSTDSTSYAWLVRAAHDAVDSGEFNPSTDQRTAQYKRAEQYGRRAVAANPNDAEGHFELARAVGRNALTMGTRDRIKFAKEVRQ